MLSILILMKYSIVVDFFKKLKKQNKNKIYTLCFGKKRPQLAEEKSDVRTSRLLTNGGQRDSCSGVTEYFGTVKMNLL